MNGLDQFLALLKVTASGHLLSYSYFQYQKGERKEKTFSADKFIGIPNTALDKIQCNVPLKRIVCI